jgi:hypothetical protein
MPEFRRINDPTAIDTKKKKDENVLYFQIWFKVTTRSRPKLKVTFPHNRRYSYEFVLDVAHSLKEEFHWAAVSVVKVVGDVP